jgi:hypothetical protein
MRTRDAPWVSEGLRSALRRLSGQQAAGVLRIVQAELAGRSITSLLEGEDRICNQSTYYRRGGWRDKPAFNQALELARRDYRAWMLEHGTQEALVLLAEGAPVAARALRRQVAGDDQALGVLVGVLEEPDAGLRMLAALHLGETGSPAAVSALRAALAREEDGEVRRALVAALGRIAAWRDEDQRDAAGEILDRAGTRTATKSTVQASVGFGLEELSDAELEQLLDNLEAAEGGGAAGATATADGGDGPAGMDNGAPEVVDPGAGV